MSRTRKMGVFTVRSTDDREIIAEVEYRFDAKKGTFSAEYGDEDFEDISVKVVQEKLTKHVQTLRKVDYTPVINVRIEGHDKHRAWSEPQWERLGLRFDVFEISKQTFTPNFHNARPYRLLRPARIEKGRVVPISETRVDRRHGDDTASDVLLPYTLARWQALEEIREAI